MSDYHHTREWRKLAAEQRTFYQTNEIYPVCHLCGQLIDPFISGRTKWGLTVDHDISIRNGGSPFDPSNMRVAHNSCNAQKAAGIDREHIHGPDYVAPTVDSQSKTTHVKTFGSRPPTRSKDRLVFSRVW
jgi:5-methylcytosine-specific restriction endonuclease McrA